MSNLWPNCPKISSNYSNGHEKSIVSEMPDQRVIDGRK